ncbi:DUF4426 domain-containing protein [Marinospirillum sp.]|uniref:DUF4426 domain-containing protein n=1 Tax=Marinospirillum sp. TaxID=2183934 RepID=UPI002870186A|nr:DUF4426 domain-containing protein [Marinospirillum sp.]
MMRRVIVLALILCLAGIPLAVSAADQERVREVGDYRIFYDVLPTSFLDPQLAQAYGLTRSKGLGLLRITVMKKREDGSLEPVEHPRVSGQAGNLVGQTRPLSFREIEVGQGEGYSTLSTFRYSGDESIRFNLKVKYASGEPAERLDFVRRLNIE